MMHALVYKYFCTLLAKKRKGRGKRVYFIDEFALTQNMVD